MKIEIKHRWSGVVLFELDTDNNTMRLTVEAAVKSGAYLSSADLRDADLRGADLRGAYLSGAYLSSADLSDADLRDADLSSADLRDADLRGADLRGAYLRDADLRGADLSDAEGADLPKARTLIVPEGSIIGWKKCQNNHIVKLRIPEEAKRSNATGRKCRAEFADVLEIIDLNDKRKKPTEAYSSHDSKFIYKVGERVTSNRWEEDRFNECAGGIHFFITRIEAEHYN